MRSRLWVVVLLLVLAVACGDNPPANPGGGTDAGKSAVLAHLRF